MATDGPTFATLDGGGRLVCLCGGRLLFPCDREGMPVGPKAGAALVWCPLCDRVLTADGVLLGRKVTA